GTKRARHGAVRLLEQRQSRRGAFRTSCLSRALRKSEMWDYADADADWRHIPNASSMAASNSRARKPPSPSLSLISRLKLPLTQSTRREDSQLGIITLQ